MGYSGRWRQDRGPRIWIRIVRSQWEVDEEGSSVGPQRASWLANTGLGPKPRDLCLPNWQFLRSQGRTLSQQRYRWDSYNSGCRSKH